MSHAQARQGKTETRGVTLVLGGVRSGKSRFAQQLGEAANHVVYIATAESRDDDEMKVKIQRHQSDRPDHWTTIEEPVELACAIHSAPLGTELILIDCLTLFAANLLERFGEGTTADHAEVLALCASLASPSSAIVLVSNEVGSGVVPAYALGRRFRDLTGEINQRIAAQADNVVFVVAGLPLILKGVLPR